MKRIFGGLLVLAVLVMAAAGQNAGSAPASIFDATDQSSSAAIQQVIQRSNDEQVKAIAARDPSLMADTLTSDHYQELVQINQKLLDSGVRSINLVNLEWGAITVDASTASATTYETWTTTLADGSTDQSRDRNDYRLVLDNGAWKISADIHPGQEPTLPSPAIPDDQNTSHNWSGYAATGGTYTSVTGTWTVPQFSADSTFGIDAAWVGIGGVRSRDLIQAGTQQTVSGSGRTQYQAWVETLPRASRPVPLRVHPGDSVTVSIVEQSADQWSIDFTNNTTGQTYQDLEHYASSHSSAEWVEEAPSSVRGGLLPLSNFGSVAFSAGTAVKDGQTVTIGSSNARAITMVGRNNQALAVPSDLGDDGTSFTVARTNAPATVPGRQSNSRFPRIPGIVIPLPGD